MGIDKMIYISHRGNINKKIIERENEPSYIMEALKQGYHVEIDIWLIENKLMLGHDKPQYIIDQNFLIHDGLWIHAKNLEAFELLINNNEVRCFWHTYENIILTSKNDIWIFPGNPIIKNSIAVLPETVSYSIEDLKICKGICSDIIEQYRQIL